MPNLADFHLKLVYCLVQFIGKDPKLAEMVFKGVLKYWPVTDSAKEILFLNELEDLLDLTKPSEFEVTCYTLMFMGLLGLLGCFRLNLI